MQRLIRFLYVKRFEEEVSVLRTNVMKGPVVASKTKSLPGRCLFNCTPPPQHHHNQPRKQFCVLTTLPRHGRIAKCGVERSACDSSQAIAHVSSKAALSFF
jgi:hypothetical protein